MRYIATTYTYCGFNSIIRPPPKKKIYIYIYSQEENAWSWLAIPLILHISTIYLFIYVHLYVFYIENLQYLAMGMCVCVHYVSKDRYCFFSGWGSEKKTGGDGERGRGERRWSNFTNKNRQTSDVYLLLLFLFHFPFVKYVS